MECTYPNRMVMQLGKPMSLSLRFGMSQETLIWVTCGSNCAVGFRKLPWKLPEGVSRIAVQLFEPTKERATVRGKARAGGVTGRGGILTAWLRGRCMKEVYGGGEVVEELCRDLNDLQMKRLDG